MLTRLLVLFLSLHTVPLYAETITRKPPEPPPETEGTKLELIEGLMPLELQLGRQRSIKFVASVYFESRTGQFIVSTHADSALQDGLAQIPTVSKLSKANHTLFFQLETRHGDALGDALQRSGLRTKQGPVIGPK